MSMPVGQAEEQALQARHRSSAASSAGSLKSRIRLPLATSCRARARPRVASFSWPVAK